MTNMNSIRKNIATNISCWSLLFVDCKIQMDDSLLGDKMKFFKQPFSVESVTADQNLIIIINTSHICRKLADSGHFEDI